MDQRTEVQKAEAETALPEYTPSQKAKIEVLKNEGAAKNMNEIRVLAEAILALSRSSSEADFALRAQALTCELHDRVVNISNRYAVGNRLTCHHRHTDQRVECNSPR